jgi:hypothetical protein
MEAVGVKLFKVNKINDAEIVKLASKEKETKTETKRKK